MANVTLTIPTNDGSSTVVTPNIGTGGNPGGNAGNLPQVQTGQVKTLTYLDKTLQLTGYTPLPQNE